MGKSFPDSSGVAESAQISQAWDNHSVLTKQQAAAYIQCCPRYIERMVRNGRLRALKPTGKLIRFRRRDLDAFLYLSAYFGASEAAIFWNRGSFRSRAAVNGGSCPKSFRSGFFASCVKALRMV